MTDFNSKRIEREQIRMYESAKESWRDALNEDMEGIEKAKKGAVETTVGDMKSGAKNKAKEAGVDDDVVKAAEKKGNKHPFVVINPPKKGSIRESVNISLQPNTDFREELSVEDQMKISRKSLKPVPKGGYDHRAIRAKQMAKAPKEKDTRTDAQKMTDATAPRKGSNFRGD